MILLRRMILQLLHILQQAWRTMVKFLQNLLANRGPLLTMDNGKSVRVGRKIAEGGFSIVFEATEVLTEGSSNSNTTAKKYALKRIACPDPELLQACRDEAVVHRAVDHPNVMPLLGMTIVKDTNGNSNQHCYMLFPLVPHSLRAQVNQRLFPQEEPLSSELPWPSILHILQVFYGILCGVEALHNIAHVSHRDIKLENVLLQNDPTTSVRPLLMDFGSAGPLEQSLANRRDVLQIAEQAQQHTTISYRPPELFEGGLMKAASHEVLDYRAVDVWSCGCLLFGMLYGTSPVECEFGRNISSSSHSVLRITECTQLSVLGKIPIAPTGSIAQAWYKGTELPELVQFMLVQDRNQRPPLVKVIENVEGLIRRQPGGDTVLEQQQRGEGV